MLDRRTFLSATAATAVTATAGPLLLATPADAALRVNRVLATGLRVPWGLGFLPSGDALVTERETARVHLVRRRGGRRRVGTVDGVDLGPAAGEGGLMGVAVSPTFRDDRLVYFYLTSDSDNRIISMRYAGGALSDRQTLLSGIPRASSHNGGRLAFGPDGRLYASTGDSQRTDQAQNTASLAGKILRLDPDGSPADGNPFDNEVWSYGHRNVQGLTWDGQGRMWATEFGASSTDELNLIEPGRNYGWPFVEGSDGPGGYTDPFASWSPTSRCSPSGVAVTKGRAWVGALAGECLYSVRLNGPKAGTVARHLRRRFGRVRTVALAPDGALWITTSNRDGRGRPGRNDDKVVRLKP